MNSRRLGSYYEDAAIEYLTQAGIDIIDRNVHCGRIGEIDIVGIDQGEAYGQTLVFFEVKYRKDINFGLPYEAVDNKKKATIRKCAEYYLAYKKHNCLIRFDVVSICGERIDWYKNAF